MTAAEPSTSPRVALLTPAGRGAVAVVAVWGGGATAAVERCFRAAAGKPLSAFPAGRIVFGHWRPPDSDVPGEELIVVRLGDDEVEVHGHGGTAAVGVILESLRAVGCEVVPWTEHVARRATDGIAAEADVALAATRTARAADILLDQAGGALRKAVEQIAGEIERGEINAAGAALDRVLSRAALGRHLTAPYRVALVGRPNVGKSSLLNALLGYRRAIVFDQPGTTRDVVTATTAFDGRLVELCDTAGRRESDDPLEAVGVDRARRSAAAADLVVLVRDVAAPPSADDAHLAAEYPVALPVDNKADLVAAAPAFDPPGLAVSALTGAGLDALIAAIVARLEPDPPAPGEAVPFTERQVALLQRARECLCVGNAAAAAVALRAL